MEPTVHVRLTLGWYSDNVLTQPKQFWCSRFVLDVTKYFDGDLLCVAKVVKNWLLSFYTCIWKVIVLVSKQLKQTGDQKGTSQIIIGLYQYFHVTFTYHAHKTGPERCKHHMQKLWSAKTKPTTWQHRWLSVGQVVSWHLFHVYKDFFFFIHIEISRDIVLGLGLNMSSAPSHHPISLLWSAEEKAEPYRTWSSDSPFLLYAAMIHHKAHFFVWKSCGL